MRRIVPALCACALVLAPAAPAAAVGDPDVAALQVALRAVGTYIGDIDGQAGPATGQALVAFQERAGLVPDGIAGPRTRKALGTLGGPELGSRSLSIGVRGWDVAELQFRLAWHGFPSGTFDGIFGPRLEAAVRRFQRRAGLPAIGIAGPMTVAALRVPVPASPLHLHTPVSAPIGDGFGPRGGAFHAGLDFTARAGATVAAAGGGRVAWAGPRGTFGNAVVVAHASGVRTLYAHMSQVDVAVGDRVSAGERLGLVGSTGRSTGPHLHFEVRVRGAAIDPLKALR